MSNAPTSRRRLPIVISSLVLLNVALSFTWWHKREAEQEARTVAANRSVAVHAARTGSIADYLHQNSNSLSDELSRTHEHASRSIKDRYNDLVTQRRKVAAIVGLATNAADFPIQRGNEIVARTYHPLNKTSFGKPETETGEPVRMLCYLPRGCGHVVCEVNSHWKKENGKTVAKDASTFEFTSNAEAVNEFICRFEADDDSTAMKLTMTMNEDTQSAEFSPCRVSYQSMRILYRRFFPNQRVTPHTAGKSGAWEESRLPANTIFHHNFTLRRRDQKGTVSVTCRVENEGTDSYCALTLAANNQSFIDRVLVDRDNWFHLTDEDETIQRTVENVLEKRDDSGLLFAKRKINLHPVRSY